MSLLVFFSGEARVVPVDVGELALLPCEPVAGTTAYIDVEPMLLTGNDITRRALGQPVPQPMLLTGATVYDNDGMSYWHACVNLHVALRSLQRQLDRNTTAFQSDPSDLHAARVSYNEEDIVEVERAIELCREWQSYFIATMPRVGRMTLSGCDVTKEKNAEITNVSMLLNPTAFTTKEMAQVDTGGGTVVDEGDSFLVTYPPGDYTLTVRGDAPCTLVAVGGGGAGAPRQGDVVGAVGESNYPGAGGGGGGVLQVQRILPETTIAIHVGNGGQIYNGTTNPNGPSAGDLTTVGNLVRCDGGHPGLRGVQVGSPGWVTGSGGGGGDTYIDGNRVARGNNGGNGVSGSGYSAGNNSVYDNPSRTGGGGGGAGGAGYNGLTQIEPNPSNWVRAGGGLPKDTAFGTYGRGGDSGGLAGRMGSWPTPTTEHGDGGYGGEKANDLANVNGFPGNNGVVMIRFSKADVESVV